MSAENPTPGRMRLTGALRGGAWPAGGRCVREEATEPGSSKGVLGSVNGSRAVEGGSKRDMSRRD
jgi:hypothetical protein